MKPIFCTRTASKLCRTYTDQHGLKALVYEFCGKTLDKRQSSSDWSQPLNSMSQKMLDYAIGDVIYLAKIKSELEKNA